MQNVLFNVPDRGFYPVAFEEDLNRKGWQFGVKGFSWKFIYNSSDSILSLNEFSPQRVRELLSECKAFSHGVPVISNERLAGDPDTGGFDGEQICLRLAQVFDSPKIFMVIREQKSLILSSYFQYLNAGGTLALKDYIDLSDGGGPPKFNKRVFLFHHLISKYQEVFGKDSILVLPYEMFRDEPDLFLERLASFSGACIPDKLPIEEKMNPLSNVVVGTPLRFLNFFTRRNSINGYSPFFLGKNFAKLERVLRKGFQKSVPKIFVNRALNRNKNIIRQSVGDYYKESNIKISELTGLDLNKYGY